MSAGPGLSRQRSISGRSKGVILPPVPQARLSGEDAAFEPCASTASLLLFAYGSTVICLHHDTLAIERRFEKHSKDIQLISADNVSETGAGRLVITYDVGRTAIVWDLFTGEQLSRFVSYEALTVAHWMRNGNVAFGNAKGEVILFEPATSEHISARTIFDPITAIAPSSDCKTYAIGYKNGSILLAALQPSFTILHTLTTSRAPSPIVSLTWHASSSKQKSDMLATQTADGDLRVWSVSKPPTSEAPRVIRVLKRIDTYLPGRNWISWSKNGRIVQFSEGKTWAWDVRTKHVTYEPIPTVDGVRAIACHGPTGTLFTLGPDYTVQQYDVERAILVANVRHLPLTVPPTPPEDRRGPIWTTSESEEELASPLVRARRELRASEGAKQERNNIPSPQSTLSSQNGGLKNGANDIISPAGRTDYTTTSFDTGIQSQSTMNQQPMQLMGQPYQPQSPVNARAARKGSRLRQEVIMSPEEQPVAELFPYTRARLHDVPYRPPRSLDESHMTPDDLRRQMLSVVFGWEEDIHDLIRDELSRHPSDSQTAIFLAKWLDEDPDYLAEIMGSTGTVFGLDWMLLALGTISNQVGAKKITQVFIEKLLAKGDSHAAATLLLALGDRSDAIEVYVSRNQYMEAVLLTCLVAPDDWQRQSYLVRRWGEHVVENSQQSLAIRCFSCTGVEPSDPWTSPNAQLATRSVLEPVSSPQSAHLQPLEPAEYPAIFQKTLERRRTLDAPTPVAMPPPHILSAIHQPPTPFRTAAAQGTRITPQTSALKLITSFGPQPSNNFKFPGLKPEDRTPTVAAAVTPIAESAIDRSAISPGGLGSYRLNNIRSINSALSAKTATPGGFQPSRLAVIGETPVDVETPQYSGALPQRSISVPAELTSSKTAEGEEQAPVVNDARAKQALTLLTSARYEPVATPVKETPQTAVGPQTVIKFPGPGPQYDAGLDHDERHLDPLRTRTGSKSRKPDGLSIQTAHVSNQEFLPSASYGDPISRPATTGSYSNTQLDTSGDLTSPPTGDSFRSVKSPIVTGRSIDQYISSLEQAQYYTKHSRARGYSSTSKQSRDDQSDRKKSRANNMDDSGEREPRRTISAAQRSPSSPVPMSPEDLRMYSTSVESFDSMYSSNFSGIDRSETPGSMSKLSRRGSQSTAKGGKSRKRSHSRHATTKSKTTSRGASRQQSPDAAIFSPRGRSSSRKENLGHRSPSSPRPMVPSEEDRQSRFDQDSALRLVSKDRHRLHRSTSRQPHRDTSARRDRSPDRRRVRARSRSRQAEEATSLSRKASRSDHHRRHRRPSDALYDRSAHPDDPEDGSTLNSILAAQDRVPRSASQPQFALEGEKGGLQAEPPQASREPLTRRPSVPNVPFSSELAAQNKPASTSNAIPPPLTRAYTYDGPITTSSFQENGPGRELSGLGLTKERPGTPRAMQVDATIPEGQEVPQVPSMSGTELLSSDVYRPPTREDISRPGSARAPASLEFLSQIPKHPAYNQRIAGSRSSSKGPEARANSRSRGTSRDRTARVSPREVPSVATSTPPIGTTETAVSTTFTASPPQHPPILPELQHLAEPPPPPPPPLLPKVLPHTGVSPNLSNLRGFDHVDAASVPLPMSAFPPHTTFQDMAAITSNTMPLSAGPLSSSAGHRRGRSGNDNQSGGSGGQLLNKLRSFTGRARSPSRGRRGGDDNQAMSPRMVGVGENVQPAPYESIPNAMMGSVGS
ncbi:uncharacterized protein Z520_00617 [Fonsecaea multimorphosa CBS 102226]|uniref:Gem-associated protein 5 TPR domain-containing protein n=1 Tax=Fonsecaea multimorphosa CBS 102226 TaxID=1442371 RepID=A0A0D2KKF9_9EURO|nr:uncharacterized protein Z520_00617 [Fonsecaea multimorphosa CBS 102226]KIY03925.1 hypothetical protein Z520_00617 [Fonsecaea multimorphosa CBS 102226]OAL31766.1 hypothetical protein AYO22_00636 [Fonsecaea multimorphosa]